MTNLTVIAVLMAVLWAISLAKRDVSIVDIFWGLGFGVIALLSSFQADQFSAHSLLITLLVLVWGCRLSAYLAWRNHGKPEDERYAAMRQKHGDRFPWVSLVTVFGLQGLLMWIIALPIQVGIVITSDWPGSSWNWVVVVGIALWAIGLTFETVGDFQLARFKADPANQGRVMNEGLWRYTRHPNYFGDFLVWWGFYLVSMEPNSWWWTVIGPLLMSFLLIRVSGVRLLESSLRSRIAGYEEYVKTTSAFFPLPPK